MRPQGMIVGALVLCLGASGCRMAAEITHNLAFEVCLFTEEVKGKVYYHVLACKELKKYQGEHPDCVSSADFAKGFKRGYADYLEFGDCSSRILPPFRYWKVNHETPEGRFATLAWLDGFRAGSAAAKASGYRELIVVRVGRNGSPFGDAMPNAPVTPQAGNAAPVRAAPTAPAMPPAEELPAPQPLRQIPPPPAMGRD